MTTRQMCQGYMTIKTVWWFVECTSTHSMYWNKTDR